MNHKIACSLCPHNLPQGRGVTLVRQFVVFHFCWNCYRERRAECEAFMDAQSAPPKQILKSRQLQRASSATVAMMLFVALGLLPALGCAGGKRRPRQVEPVVYRHCTVTTELPGFVGCDCPKPLQAWDAQLKRRVVYCDGKVQE